MGVLIVAIAMLNFAHFAEKTVVKRIQPITQSEIQQGLKDMQQRMNQQI